MGDYDQMFRDGGKFGFYEIDRGGAGGGGANVAAVVSEPLPEAVPPDTCSGETDAVIGKSDGGRMSAPASGATFSSTACGRATASSLATG